MSVGGGWNMLVRYVEIFQFFWASECLKEMIDHMGFNHDIYFNKESEMS